MSEEATIPKGTKPSKVLARGREAGFRPALGQAVVRDGNLYATDSYTMVRLPVSLPDCTIPRAILEAGEKPAAEGIELRDEAVRVRLKDGTVVEGTPVDQTAPNYEALVPEVGRPVKVALNPDLLRNVALGLGARRGVVLTLDAGRLARKDGYGRAIKVEPLGAEDDRLGLLMPIQHAPVYR